MLYEKVRDETGGVSRTLVYPDVVDLCPVCHHQVKPKRRAHQVTTPVEDIGSRLRIIYDCPRIQCQALFIADFIRAGSPSVGHRYELKDLYPRQFKSSLHPELVEKLSPRFRETFRQAEQAEAQGLSEICGPGYRKALELLIKDFCMKVHPDKADRIRAILLGACIKEFVSDSRVKACAERAAWLGNDETHYEKRWVSKDIADLKTLIHLVVNFVDNELIAQKYLEEMPG